MADKAWNRKQVQKISKQIDKLFANIPNTRYWILVNYYRPENSYNFFFNINRRRTYQRSWPIAQLPDIKFKCLIKILQGIRKQYKFTMKFSNFTKAQRQILHKEID